MAMATVIPLLVLFSALLGKHSTLSQSILHFQEEPLSTNVYDGQTLVLRCVLQSSWSSGVVHWVKDDTVQISLGSTILIRQLSEATRFSIIGDRSQGNNNLEVKNVKPSDAGSYVCHLYDSLGSHQAETATSTVTVLPIQPPLPGYPRCPLSKVNPGPGDTIIFRCYSIGEQPSAVLSFWRGPHEELQVERYYGSYGGVFFERQLNEDDNNVTFTCMAKGPAFKPESHKNCTVIPFLIPTTVNISPALAEVPTGMTATFHCKTVAVPQVNKYRWWVWNNGWDRILRTEGRYVLDGDGESMRILDINKYDDGRKVRCIARNPLGLKGEGEGKLSVYVVRPTARGPIWSGGQGGQAGQPGDNNQLHNSSNPTERNEDGFKIGTGPNVFLIVGCVVAGFFGIIFITTLIVVVFCRESRDKHVLKHQSICTTIPTENLIRKEGNFKNDLTDKGCGKPTGYATLDSVPSANSAKTTNDCRLVATLEPKPMYAKPVLRTNSSKNTIFETSYNATKRTDRINISKKQTFNSETILAMYAKPMKGKADRKNTLGERPIPYPRRDSGKSETSHGKNTVAPRPKSDILHSKPNNKQKIYENSSLGLDLSEVPNTTEGSSLESSFRKNVEGLVYAELNLQETPAYFNRSVEIKTTEYAKIKSNNKA